MKSVRPHKRSGSFLLLAMLMPGIIATGAAVAQRADRVTMASHSKPSPLFTRNDVFVAGGFAAATVALFPLDEHIATRLQNPSAQADRFFHHAATDFEWFGSPDPS